MHNGSVLNAGELTLESDHLARMVKSSAIAGLAELVWNSLDAEATTIDVEVRLTVAGAVDQVLVTDDGHGFSPDEVEDLMSSVGGSWKASKGDRKTRNGARILHGRKGEGRLQAFAFGDVARWQSVALVDGASTKTEFNIRRDDLKRYEWSSSETSSNVGTKVTVSAGMREPRVLANADAADKLLRHLALYLTEYPDVVVRFNGDRLDPNKLIDRRDELAVDYENDAGSVSVTVIEWHEPVDRALFLCDEEGATLHETEARLQAPGFNFTGYVKWEGFRTHEVDLLLADAGSPETGPALEAARRAIREHFRKRAVERSRSVVEDWRSEDVYPFADEPADDVERAEQALFNFVAVTASAAVNRIDDKQAKALSLRTMKHVVTDDPGSLEVIFREVLSLPEDKLAELHSLVERTPLTSLVGAMKKITGRLEFLAALELMLFDPQVAPDVLERAHLQEIIGAEPWLFGEEFALHVSDKGLTALLQAHLGILGRDSSGIDAVRDESGRVRRVDFMFGRCLELNRLKTEHLVVEIKRPTVVVTRDELNQIEDYARAVASDSRFDVETTEWDFVVVSAELDGYVAERSTQPGKPKGLAFESPDGRVRVWARQWNSIIADARHRLKFVRSQLEYDPGADEAVTYLQENYPEYVPQRVAELKTNED